MVKVFEGTDNEFYMDGYLKHAFDIAKKQIKNDWDFVFVYDGEEGSGKSVKAMCDAFYCDPSMTLDSYAFKPNEFKAAIQKAPQYGAIVYDEAHSGLNSRAAMTMINRSLVSMLTEIRQKNLFVFIILPTFFDLDKYVALWRSRALIHVYTSKSFERGYFAFYNKDRKKDLYVLGKKLYKYSVTKPNFIGRFTNHYPLDQDQYRKLKYKALMDKSPEGRAPMSDQELRDIIFDRVKDIDEIPNRVKSKIIGITERAYYQRMQRNVDFSNPV